MEVGMKKLLSVLGLLAPFGGLVACKGFPSLVAVLFLLIGGGTWAAWVALGALGAGLAAEFFLRGVSPLIIAGIAF
jgi:hypothetical protein